MTATAVKHIQWSQPSTYGESGVHHGYRTAKGSIDDLEDMVGLVDVAKVWWGMLDPGGFIVPHIDASPWFRRWHYPIEPAGYVWHGGETLESPTEPFAITHWEPHAVWNPSTARRIHLIVETGEQIPGDSDLVICPMIPVIQVMIDGL